MNTLRSKLQQILFSMTLNQIVAGMLGALIILVIVHVSQPPPKAIGSVDVSGLVTAFVKSHATDNAPPQTIKQLAADFGQQLQLALDTVARKHHVTLLMQQAVVAGAQDYTAEVKALLLRPKKTGA